MELGGLFLYGLGGHAVTATAQNLFTSAATSVTTRGRSAVGGDLSTGTPSRADIPSPSTAANIATATAAPMSPLDLKRLSQGQRP